MAAQATSYLTNATFDVITLPMRSWGPPKYSATIAAITDRGATNRRELAKNGRALGIRTSRRIVHSLAA